MGCPLKLPHSDKVSSSRGKVEGSVRHRSFSRADQITEFGGDTCELPCERIQFVRTNAAKRPRNNVFRVWCVNDSRITSTEKYRSAYGHGTGRVSPLT